jgi:hypothetical protein
MRQWYPDLIIGDNGPRRDMSIASKQQTVCDMCHTKINYRQTGGCLMPENRGDPACEIESPACPMLCFDDHVSSNGCAPLCCPWQGENASSNSDVVHA